MSRHSLLTFKSKTRTSGFTLVEVMVAISLTAVLLLIVSTVTGDILKSVQQNNTTSSRDELVVLIRKYSTDIKSLKISRDKPENADFCKCIRGMGCTTGKKYSLSLFDSSGLEKQSPAYYTAAGNRCKDKTDTNCQIEVMTTFVAQCQPVLPSADPNPPLNCPPGPIEFIQITYTVQQNPHVPPTGTLMKSSQGTAYLSDIPSLAEGGLGCP